MGRALRPIVEKGDTWAYRIVRTLPNQRKVTEVETHRVTLVDEAADSIYVSVDRRPEGVAESPEPDLQTIWTLEWNSKLFSRAGFGKGTILRPHSETFRFPIKPGDRYEYSYENLSATQDGPGYEWIVRRSASVLGWETVSVPAGSFMAIVIEATGSATLKRTGLQMPTVMKQWYSPEVRRWVKALLTWPELLEAELLSFKLHEN